MSDKRRENVSPSKISLTFAGHLPETQLEDAKKFPWLRRHMKNLAKKYSRAKLIVNSVGYFPGGKVKGVDIVSSFDHPDGAKGSYTYSVTPDTVNVLIAFKLVNMSLTGRRLRRRHGEDRVDYALLTVGESRFPWGRPKAEGPVGGFLEADDSSVFVSARREIKEETRWAVSRDTKLIPVRSYFVQGGSTEKRTVLGIYQELDGANPEDRAFVKNLRKSHGGLAEESEKTRVRLRSFGQFLSLNDTRDRFGPDLREFVEIIAAQGDQGPKMAYEGAEDSLRKRILSRKSRRWALPEASV